MKNLKAWSLVVLSFLLLVVTGCGKKTETYNVSFDSNGGSSVAAQTVEEGKSATKPTDPTRDGYTFEGWFINLDDTDSYDFSKKVTSNVSLKAKWSQASSGEVVKATAVKIDGASSVSLNASNKTASLKATVTPENATSKVTWSSSNKNVATVDENGNVTAVANGTATITAKIDGKTASVKVTVSGLAKTASTTNNNSGKSNSSSGSKSNSGSSSNNNNSGSNNNQSGNTTTPEDPTPDTPEEPKEESYTYEDKGTPAGMADVQSGIIVYDASGKDVSSTVDYIANSNGNYLGEYNATAKMVVVNKNEASSIAKVVIGGKTYDIKKK